MERQTSDMEEIILNDGNKIPIIGFGTYQAMGQEGTESVKIALNKGYRMIDTAAKYENEVAVSKGIKATDKITDIQNPALIILGVKVNANT